MSKLAFSGEGRYPDFRKGYRLYVNRSRKGGCVDERTYRRIVLEYCRLLSRRLLENGTADLPNGMGMIAAALVQRKPQYRNGKFVGIGKMDYKTGERDWSRKAFGLVFLPAWRKCMNLRCYGFVGNRTLFRKMKALYESGDCPWTAVEFNDSII